MYSMSADLLNDVRIVGPRPGGARARSRPHTLERSCISPYLRARSGRARPETATNGWIRPGPRHARRPRRTRTRRSPTVRLCTPALLLIPDIMPFGAGAGGQRRPQRRRRRPRARGEVRGDTGGERAAGGQGRAPLQLTVAGMLTHAHASTVSYAGMTPRADT